MKNHLPEDFEKVFGSFAKPDKCLTALNLKDPLPCKRVKLGNTPYCQQHNSIFVDNSKAGK